MLELLREVEFVGMLVMAIAAWVAFADHPTARNLRTAIVDTLGL